MDTIIVKPKNKEAIPFLKKLLESLSNVESVWVQSENAGTKPTKAPKPNKVTLDALIAVKEGKTYKAKSVKELFNGIK